ncbi:P116 family lipid acquisition surface protein [Mycoplasma bradburyae]|uniref:Uncharacterized protein n=1 Tax=Mycoplasma bradburyae TaxID=2963128 RepID=A0AAW6HSR7_9MOLU|nr:hypothetical protein [Mycoplasma bradburyae]MDC4183565.1 hypothetical protein [Mycoplasma bradburyae]
MNRPNKNKKNKTELIPVKGIDLDDLLSEEISVLDRFDNKNKKPQLLLEDSKSKQEDKKNKSLSLVKKTKKPKVKLVTDPRILKKRSKFLTIGVSLIGFGIAGPLLSFAILKQVDKKNQESSNIKRKDNTIDTLKPTEPKFKFDDSLPKFYNSYLVNKRSEVNGVSLTNKTNPVNLPIESYQIHGKLIELLTNQVKFNYSWLYSDIAYFIRKTYDNNSAFFTPVGINKVNITKSSDNNPLHVNINGQFTFRNQSDQARTFVFWYFNKKYEQLIDGNAEVSLSFQTQSSSNDVNPLTQPNYIGTVDSGNLAPGYGYINAVVTKDLFYNYYLNWNVSNLKLEINNNSYQFANFIFNNNVPSMNVILTRTAPGKNPYEAANDLVGKNKLLNRDLTPSQLSKNLKSYFRDKYFSQLETFKLIHDIIQWLIDNKDSNKKAYQLLSDKAASFARLFSFYFSGLNISYADQRNAIEKLIVDALTSNTTIPGSKNVYEVLYDNINAFKLILNTYFLDISAYENIFDSLTKDIHSAFDFYQRFYETIPILRKLISNYPTKIKYFNIIERILGYRDDAGNLIPTPKFETYLVNIVFESKNLFNDIYDQLLNIVNGKFGGTSDEASANNYNDQNNQIANSFPPLFKYIFIKKRDTFIKLITQSTNYFDELITLFSANNFDFLFGILDTFGLNIKNIDTFLKTSLDIILFKNPELLSREKLKAKILNLFTWIARYLEQQNINKIKFNYYKPENLENLELIETENSLKVKKLDVGFKFEINEFDIPYGLLSALFDFLPNIKIIDFLKFLVDDKRYAELKEKAFQQAIKDGYKDLLSAAGVLSFKWVGDPAKNFFSEVFDNIWNNQVISGIRDNGRTIRDLANEIFSGTNNNNPNSSIITFKGVGYLKWYGENVDVLPYFKVLPSNANETQIAYQLYNVDFENDFRDIYQKIELHFPKYQYNRPSIPFSDISKKVYESIFNTVQDTLNLSINRKYKAKTRIVLPGDTGIKANLILDETNPYEHVALFTYNANLSIVNNFDRSSEQIKRRIREQVLRITNRRSHKKGLLRDPDTLETRIDDESLKLLDSLIEVKGVDKKWIVRASRSLSTISKPNELNLSTNFTYGAITKKVPIDVAYEAFLTSFSYRVMVPYPILDMTNPNAPTFKLKAEISHLIFSIELFGVGE